MEKIQVGRKKALLYAAFVLLLLVFQRAAGIAARAAADMFSYVKIDPDSAFAWNFVRHISLCFSAV